MRYNYLTDTMRLEEARELARRIMAEGDKLPELYRQEFRCQLLFYEIIWERRREEIERLYTKELKRYIEAGATHLSNLRLQYAYEMLVTHDDKAAETMAARFHKACLTYPNIGDIAGEQEMMAMIDNLANIA